MIYLTLKLSKHVTLSPFTYEAIQWVFIDLYSSRILTYAAFFALGKLFLKQTPLNLGSFR